jgi:hypothetical protein
MNRQELMQLINDNYKPGWIRKLRGGSSSIRGVNAFLQGGDADENIFENPKLFAQILLKFEVAVADNTSTTSYQDNGATRVALQAILNAKAIYETKKRIQVTTLTVADLKPMKAAGIFTEPYLQHITEGNFSSASISSIISSVNILKAHQDTQSRVHRNIQQPNQSNASLVQGKVAAMLSYSKGILTYLGINPQCLPAQPVQPEYLPLRQLFLLVDSLISLSLNNRCNAENVNALLTPENIKKLNSLNIYHKISDALTTAERGALNEHLSQIITPAQNNNDPNNLILKNYTDFFVYIQDKNFTSENFAELLDTTKAKFFENFHIFKESLTSKECSLDELKTIIRICQKSQSADIGNTINLSISCKAYCAANKLFSPNFDVLAHPNNSNFLAQFDLFKTILKDFCDCVPANVKENMFNAALNVCQNYSVDTTNKLSLPGAVTQGLFGATGAFINSSNNAKDINQSAKKLKELYQNKNGSVPDSIQEKFTQAEKDVAADRQQNSQAALAARHRGHRRHDNDNTANIAMAATAGFVVGSFF